MHAIKRIGAALLLTGALVGCTQSKKADIAPPRATDSAPTPSQQSLIAVPIETSTSLLRQELERAVPRVLWTINKRDTQCVPPQRVKIFGRNIKVTPPIKCTIVGRVTRGSLRLRGDGDEIVVEMPIKARITGSDVGGVLKSETATGSAMAYARVRVELLPDWSVRGKARIRYGWTKPPSVEFLGQRIFFADEADKRLGPVVGKVEGVVNREIGRINIKRQVAEIWRKSFTTLNLNRENPPVWMRVTPQRILFGGYQVDTKRMRLDLGLEAMTETFVANRPDDPAPTPLPPLAFDAPRPHLDIFVPVIADYAKLEPVILRAVTRRARRPFDIPHIGPVTAVFKKVIAYGAPHGKIAIGVDLEVQPPLFRESPISGRIWMTAVPLNDPGSATVRFTHLEISGDTDRAHGDLLLAFGKSPAYSTIIADALTQDFTRDIEELEGKIRLAIEERREGDFNIRTSVDSFEIGKIKAYGNGLYLPVQMKGSARVDYRPSP